MMAKLRLDDIADVRAYERERAGLLRHMIDLRAARRVALGPVVTIAFENAETVRFQIQEMARVERMSTDAQIQAELDAYNPLIPEPGELSATLFIECTTREELERWLPALVGIERSVLLRIGDAPPVRAEPIEGHVQTLTRSDVTASVHYLRWRLGPDAAERMRAGRVFVQIDHERYDESAEIGDRTKAELLADLEA